MAVHLRLQILVVTCVDVRHLRLSLCRNTFSMTVLDVLKEQSDEAELQSRREQAYRQKVIDAFFEYGRLKSIPAQRKKERIVLEEIAKAFEPDRIYSEREVNIIIADYHDDFCTIRRDMISERLLDRDSRGYWRIFPEGRT